MLNKKSLFDYLFVIIIFIPFNLLSLMLLQPIILLFTSSNRIALQLHRNCFYLLISLSLFSISVICFLPLKCMQFLNICITASVSLFVMKMICAHTKQQHVYNFTFCLHLYCCAAAFLLDVRTFDYTSILHATRWKPNRNRSCNLK